MLVHIPSRHARLSFSIGLILIVSILFCQPLPADASLNEPAPTDLTTSSPDFPLPFHRCWLGPGTDPGSCL